MIKDDLFQICKAVLTIEINQSKPSYQQTTESNSYDSVTCCRNNI